MLEKVSRGLTLNEQVNKQLVLKGYIPPVVESLTNRFAVLGTNEKIDSSFFKSIKNHNPDGYIVAIGCGMSLGLPLGFKTDKPPKGVVLVDVDKEVTIMSKAFVNAVAQTKNFTEFYNNFYMDPLDLASNYLAGDKEALEILKNMKPAKKSNINELIEMSRGKYNERISKNGDPSIDNMLGATYDIWKKLVMEGKVAVIQGSLTDTEVIDAITNLPEYQNSTNLVYLSNITNHMVRSNSWEKCENTLTPYLQTIAHYNPKEHPALFIDTLRSFDYRLRVSKGAPDIYPADMRAINASSIPEGFHFPRLNYKKQPKNFTELDLSQVDGDELNLILEQLYTSLYAAHPENTGRALRILIAEIRDFMLNEGDVDKRFYGGMKPLDWVSFRFGNEVGQVVVVLLEIEKRKDKK